VTTAAALLLCCSGLFAWPTRPQADRRLGALISAGRLPAPLVRRPFLVMPRMRLVVRGWTTYLVGCVVAAVAGLAVGYSAAVLTALALSALARRQSRSRYASDQRATLRALSVLHTELVCGTRAAEAMHAALRSYQCSSGRHGVAALIELSRVPASDARVRSGLLTCGEPVWVKLGTAWQLAEQSGVALSTVIDAVKQDLSARVEGQRDIHVTTAGARSSAAMLAMLPILGLLLGSGLGAAPVPWLLSTPTGHLLLCAGVTLGGGGVLLTRAILDRSVVSEGKGELPLLLELVAVGLSSGQPLELCLLYASEGASSGWERYFSDVGGLLRLGASPETAWIRAAAVAPRRRRGRAAQETVAAVRQAVVRSGHSGAALAGSFVELAQQFRSESLAVARSRAARCSTLVIVPLGLCFLPAFICLGIAPTVFAALKTVLQSNS